MELERPFDMTGKVAVITGGAGVLCSTMARALARCGADIALLDINLAGAEAVVSELTALGARAIPVQANVLDKASLIAAAQRVMDTFGRVDILINGAGGNKKEATSSDALAFFDLPAEAVRWVFELNFIGTLLPSQVFGQLMVAQDSGCILNISSVSSFRPLTRVVAYSAAKGAINNFTQWLAVHIAQNYSSHIRDNAIAPGFFLTDQNRFLLTDEQTGELTQRGRDVIDQTPMGRFGDPEELVPGVLWLLSDGASFVHGAVVPIDGGFSAFSGV